MRNEHLSSPPDKDGKDTSHNRATHHKKDNESVWDKIKTLLLDFAELFGIPAGAFLYVWQNRNDVSTIVVTGLAIVFFVHGICRSFRLIHTYVIVIITSIVAAVGGVFWYNEVARNPDPLRVYQDFSHVSPDGPSFWAGQGNNLYPLHLVFRLNVQNVSSETISVDRFWVETRDKMRNWKPLYSSYDEQWDIYRLDRTATNCWVIKWDDELLSSAFKRSIDEKQWVRGMVFVEMPSFGFGDSWRLCVQTRDGRHLNLPFAFPNTPAVVDLNPNWPISNPSYKLMERRDLKTMQLNKPVSGL